MTELFYLEPQLVFYDSQEARYESVWESTQKDKRIHTYPQDDSVYLVDAFIELTATKRS